MNAFPQCVLQHQRLVQGYLRKLLKDFHLAEDLTQETLLRVLRVWKRGGKIPPEPLPWLLRIARHVAIDYRRKRAEVKLDGDLLQEMAEDPGQLDSSAWSVSGKTLAEDELRALMETGVRQLSPEYSALIRYRYEKGYKCWELAARYGLSVEGAKIRLHRGRRHLKKIIERNVNQSMQGGKS